MIVRIALFLCSLFPALKRRLWRAWYQYLARRGAAESWTFMNYGYAVPENKQTKLDPSDECDRASIQLYQRAIASVNLQGKQVLEVGCGRGGGASYLARYHGITEVVAIDYAPFAIELCRQRHASVPNLTFALGDAENLQFPNQSFDIVVNIESSHCYGNVPTFFREVARVLRPGGCFLFADARENGELPKLNAQLAAIDDWEVIETEDITAEVVAALTSTDEWKRKLIQQVIVPKRRQLLGEFAALRGTTMYKSFDTRRFVYRRWCLKKRTSPEP